MWSKTLFITGCFSVALSGCSSQPETSEELSVRVEKNCQQQVACYTSVQQAIEAVTPTQQGNWATIYIGPGDFYEKVTIRSDKLKLIGSGSQLTRIHFDEVAQTAGKYHRKNWGTPGSATLTLDGDLLKVSDLTIENSFDYLANDARSKEDPNRVRHAQAAAVLLDIHSDRVSFNRVAMLAYQDTLFANGKRAYIRNSKVAGNVDFIFGNGQLLIEDSVIESRKRGKSFNPGVVQSYITAPSTSMANPMGIVIYRSQLTAEHGVPAQAVTLGRPWHPTTTFEDGRYADPDAVGQASFIDCYMGEHIHPDHWSSMRGTARDGSKTDVFTPQTGARFSESGSYGPGAEANDIGMSWAESMTIDEIHSYLFKDWSESER